MQALKRGGLPQMTDKMLDAMRVLRTAQRASEPWVTLPGVHRRTINSMIDRDWIVEADGAVGQCYRITHRGLKALEVYEAPSRYRFDGLCPDCGEQPVHISPGGTNFGYCLACRNQRSLAYYHEHGPSLVPGKPCAQCGERPRHTSPSGRTISYCLECRNSMRAEERKRKHARLIERQQGDNPALCIRCKQAPRYHTRTVCYDYCRDCYRETQSDYRRRRAWQRVVGKAVGR